MNFIKDLFKEKIIIIGNGDFAREVADTCLDNNLRVIGFIGFDNIHYRDIKTIGNDDDYIEQYNDIPYVIGIGDCKIRQNIHLKFATKVNSYTLISKRASLIGEDIQIKNGTIIQPGCVLTNRINIGWHTILNLNTTIGHDVNIGPWCNLSPGCHINGHTKIDFSTNLGSGTVTVPKSTIGSHCIIGAGSVVKGNIEDYSVAVGVPAKVIKKVEL